jgi:hypothetical protein
MMKISMSMILLTGFIFFECNKNENPIQPGAQNPPAFTYTHQDSVEGGAIALWFDGNLLAADSTQSRLMYSLKYLRESFLDSQAAYPMLDSVFLNRFHLPWAVGQLGIGFDTASAALIRNHEYTGWSSLDISLRPDTIEYGPDAMGVTFIGFNKPYNPVKLATIYMSLPGVLWAEPDYFGSVSGSFPLYPGINSGEMSYVFQTGYIQPIAGPYFYFQYKNGKPTFIGEWNGWIGKSPWGHAVQQSVDSFSVWKGY